MATSVQAVADPGIRPAARNSIVVLLRLEALAVAAIAAVLYARTGASWWLFAALWLVPDLSMLGYLAGPCQGARVYNAFHTYVAPVALGATAWVTHAPALMAVSLIWINHIGVDRLLGFGLKFANGFGATHLGSARQWRASAGH